MDETSYHTFCKHGIPIVIENPVASRLRIAPVMKNQIKAAECNINLTHCIYGAAWMKNTKLASWNMDILRVKQIVLQMQVSATILAFLIRF